MSSNKRINEGVRMNDETREYLAACGIEFPAKMKEGEAMGEVFTSWRKLSIEEVSLLADRVLHRMPMDHRINAFNGRDLPARLMNAFMRCVHRMGP